MKKTYKLQDLDCAGCAAKMENAVNQIEGVEKASISFMTQKMTIEAEESKHPQILELAKKMIRKVEPDCLVIG